MHLGFPLRLDDGGLLAAVGSDEHVRNLIEQVLFTGPGERVNRPDFGCGLQQFIFGQAGSEQAVAIQGLVQGALQQWLRDVIQVERVSVVAEDSTLSVTIQYVNLRSRQRQTARFARPALTA